MIKKSVLVFLACLIEMMEKRKNRKCDLKKNKK